MVAISRSSLSGIEPLFPVTRYNHGRPRPYHLIDRAEIQMEHRLLLYEPRISELLRRPLTQGYAIRFIVMSQPVLTWSKPQVLASI